MLMRYTLAAAITALGFGIAPAPAFSPADAIKEFGLLGTWAIHCEQPVGQENAFVTYEIRDGIPVRTTRTYWQDVSGTATILDARVVDVSHLEQTWKMRDFTFEQIIEMKDGRYRLIRSKGGDGNVYYQDGRNIADGKETPWLERCQQ